MAQLPVARAVQRRLDMEERGPSFQETKSCLNKISYKTRRAARLAARQSVGRGASKLSLYRCPHCELFHLTKTENHHRRRHGAP